jgi:hypothetical protein
VERLLETNGASVSATDGSDGLEEIAAIASALWKMQQVTALGSTGDRRQPPRQPTSISAWAQRARQDSLR